MLICRLLFGVLLKVIWVLCCWVICCMIVRFSLVLLVGVLGVWKKCLFRCFSILVGMLGLLFFICSSMLLLGSGSSVMVVCVLWLV